MFGFSGTQNDVDNKNLGIKKTKKQLRYWCPIQNIAIPAIDIC